MKKIIKNVLSSEGGDIDPNQIFVACTIGDFLNEIINTSLIMPL